MEELLQKAEDLGMLLAEHPRFKALMMARDAVRSDQIAKNLMGDYQAQVEKMQELAIRNRPIEVDDKHRLSELEQEVASNDKLKGLARAQADFSEVMSRVNRTIYDKIALVGQPVDD